jgi:hypothetical protein
VFFVGAAAIVADLVTPAAVEHLMLKCFLLASIFTRVLAITPFVGAPPCVFVNQDSFNKPHDLDQCSERVGVQKLALVGKSVRDEFFILNVVFGAKTNSGGFSCLGRENLIKKRLHCIIAW